MPLEKVRHLIEVVLILGVVLYILGPIVNLGPLGPFGPLLRFLGLAGLDDDDDDDE
jgi:hypothetical protein